MLCVDAGARKEERVKRAQLYRGGRRRKESKTSAPTHYSKPIFTQNHHKRSTQSRIVQSPLPRLFFQAVLQKRGGGRTIIFIWGFAVLVGHDACIARASRNLRKDKPHPRYKTSRTTDKNTAPSSNLPNQRQKHRTIKQPPEPKTKTPYRPHTPFPKDIPTIKTTPEPKQRLRTDD